MTKLEKQRRALMSEIRAVNRTGVDDLKRALEVLSSAAAPAIVDLPTRQQRRHAERQRQKARR